MGPTALISAVQGLETIGTSLNTFRSSRLLKRMTAYLNVDFASRARSVAVSVLVVPPLHALVRMADAGNIPP